MIGPPRGLPFARSSGNNRRVFVRIVTLIATLFVFAFAAGCGGDEEPAAEQTPTAEATEAGGTEVAGREQFASTCGGCHTLADAGTGGRVGPDLDQLSPDADTVLSAIQTGPGGMPANLLEGEEAREVAEYVAANAGG